MTTTPAFALTPDIIDLVTGALDAGAALLLAAVDRQGRPVLSYRGSTAVYSQDQLCLWVRNAEGGTIDAITHNPNVAMMYRSAAVPMLQFAGRARIVDDAAELDRAFALAHERERRSDPERKGRAVVIDLDFVGGVTGFDESGPKLVRLARG